MKLKICTNATLTEQTVDKQTKPLKTSRKNLFPFIVHFLVRVARAAVFHHPHHFAWVKSKAIPLEILNVILIHLQ